jgi:hypothetical protein
MITIDVSEWHVGPEIANAMNESKWTGKAVTHHISKTLTAFGVCEITSVQQGNIDRELVTGVPTAAHCTYYLDPLRPCQPLSEDGAELT